MTLNKYNFIWYQKINHDLLCIIRRLWCIWLDTTHRSPWSLLGWTRGHLKWSLNYKPWLWLASCHRFNKMPSDTTQHRECQDTDIQCQHCPEPQRSLSGLTEQMGGLASALIRPSTLHPPCLLPALPNCIMGTGTRGEVAEVTAGWSRSSMAVAWPQLY